VLLKRISKVCHWLFGDYTKTAKLAQGRICPKNTVPDYCQVPLESRLTLIKVNAREQVQNIPGRGKTGIEIQKGVSKKEKKCQTST